MGQQIDSAAHRAAIPIEPAGEWRDRALFLQEPLGVAGTTAHAHIDPVLDPLRRPVAPEIKGPSVSAQPRSEPAVHAAQAPHEYRQEPLVAKPKQRDFARWPRFEIMRIQKRKGAE